MSTAHLATQALAELFESRRVTRRFTSEALPEDALADLAWAAYRAPSGGARRPVKLIAVAEPRQLRRLCAVSPGVIGNPLAALVLCLDWGRAPHLKVEDARDTHSLHMDIGAAMTQILVMAEAAELGACPATSIHRASISTLLHLPDKWTPMMVVSVGYPARPTRRASRGRPDLSGFLYRERYTNQEG